MTQKLIIIPIFFLFGVFIFALLSKSFAVLGKIKLRNEFKEKKRLYFFYFLMRRLFPKSSWEALFFSNGATKQIIRVLFASTSIFYLLSQKFFSSVFIFENQTTSLSPCPFVFIVVIVVLLGLFIDFCGKLIGLFFPVSALKGSFPFASLFFLAFFPISYCLLKIQKVLTKDRFSQEGAENSTKIKDKILELVLESELQKELSLQEKRLIISVASFKDRIAREIMVPRISVLSISTDATLADAATLFKEEGYSRLPVYKENVDNIIGVLMSKDVLNYYIDWEAQLTPSPNETIVGTLLKPIIYAPETKRISHLLQEFRSKQCHLAIIVDEYGGTEGIVSIEDVLEELVGEIADEYDNIQEELQFKSDPNGGWIIDARMNINDVELELGVVIPQAADYDTIGGYIFQKTGTIPKTGWKIHHDNFDLEVLSSNERSVEKVRIIPSKKDEL